MHLDHASIIDGVWFAKAQRYRYANADMNDSEKQLKAAHSCRFRLGWRPMAYFQWMEMLAHLDKFTNFVAKYDKWS